MGIRAEAVMLNKGPEVIRAIHTLTKILDRMEGHQIKKFNKLRKLGVAALDFKVT